jgi:hypothetical protein
MRGPRLPYFGQPYEAMVAKQPLTKWQADLTKAKQW